MSEDKLDQLIAMSRDLKEDVTRLNTAVIGDESAGVTGVCKRLGKVEHKIETVQDEVKCLKTVGSTLGVIWGAVITVIAVFKHKIL